MDCDSIFKCLYLITFSPFTFSELSTFSIAFLSQVFTLDSLLQIQSRGISKPNSVHSLSSQKKANMMNWKLEFGRFNGTCPTTSFEIHSSNITEQDSYHINWLLLARKSKIHHRQLDAITSLQKWSLLHELLIMSQELSFLNFAN